MDEFYISDGKQFKKLGYISEAELTAEDVDYPSFNCEPITISSEIEVIDTDGLNAIRKIVSGGDRSLYNALTLKEEGHLGLDNAWL